ncbi:MAG: transposase, partial [Romboutsia sp.]|nr:transposase [Romboutsia sp.]
RKSNTLFTILTRYISEESIIYTNCWRRYSKLSEYFFIHKIVNHSISFVDIETGVHKNMIEGTQVAVKAQTPVRGRTNERISFYLLRFMIKRNSPGDYKYKLI